MELLFSNYPPVKTKYHTFSDAFYSMVPQSTELNIAVGYITSDSLIELQKVVELNTLKSLNLTIGMHYLERFTKVEYNAALKLNDFLRENKCGEVRLVTPFRYHGKLYSYSNEQGAFAGMACQMHEFINKLVTTSTDNISDLKIDNFREVNPLLEGHEYVKKLPSRDVAEVLLQRTDITFDIPIKPYEDSPHSNLNVFFGKGRESKNGLIKPRHWYEVELIVPKSITAQNGYPQESTPEAIFDVVTDDGWSFKCKVSGTNSKNLRSEGDLKILGKWLKGRLENAGVLKVGDPVCRETLKQYGRDTFTLTKTIKPGVWYLDFGVEK